MITLTLSAPYYYEATPTAPSTPGSSGEVPGLYDVAVGGHPYLLDRDSDQHAHTSIATLRPVFVQSDTLGEKNINPESLFRASQITWHHGAGQRHLDHSDSDPSMFYQSKGIDVWERWQASLLPDTSQARASANTNLRMAVAGTYLYLTDGNTLYKTTDLTTFTAITGTPGAAATGIASDGYSIYTAYTSNGLWVTTRGGAAATQLVTGTDTLDTVGYVKGRLMVSKGRSLYNVTSATPAALPTSLFDQPNTDFIWVGFAEGSVAIYAAGYSGDKSLIYRIGVTSDGTALSAPIVAGQLPDGEIVRSIGSYLGFVLIGSDSGFRFCVPTESGDLQVGPLVTAGPCYCFEGQERFVWFGWNNYDTVSTGLGRMDLTVLTGTLTPAYASDLMATGQGTVRDVATFGNMRVFTIAGLGVYQQSASLVSQGTLDSGLITYDLPDEKVALFLDVKHDDPLIGTHAALIAVDRGVFATVGGHTAGDPEGPFVLPELRGETFEIRQLLERDGTDHTQGPVITRQTLLANPAVDTGFFITVPVLLVEQEEFTAQTRQRDPAAELNYLKGLRTSGVRVIYQEGATSWSVTVSDLEWKPTGFTQDRSAFNGTCLLKLKTI